MSKRNNPNDNDCCYKRIKRISVIHSILISTLMAALMLAGAGSSVIAQTATAPFTGSSANPENFSSASGGGAAQTINVVTNPASIVTSIVRQPGEAFILTPTIARIFPGLTLLLNQSVKTEQNLASVEQIQMKFAENGTNVRFSFGVSGTVPISLPLPAFGSSSTVSSALAIPPRALGPSGTVPISFSSNSSGNTNTFSSKSSGNSNINSSNSSINSNTNTNRSSNSLSVLFLDINSSGQVVQPFSSPAAFVSSPSIEILVNKTVGIAKLKDGSGCPDIALSTFNESSASWQTLSKPTRTASIDTPVACGFTLETEHFSKFAVGGVRSLAPSLL